MNPPEPKEIVERVDPVLPRARNRKGRVTQRYEASQRPTIHALAELAEDPVAGQVQTDNVKLGWSMGSVDRVVSQVVQEMAGLPPVRMADYGAQEIRAALVRLLTEAELDPELRRRMIRSFLNLVIARGYTDKSREAIRNALDAVKLAMEDPDLGLKSKQGPSVDIKVLGTVLAKVDDHEP